MWKLAIFTVLCVSSSGLAQNATSFVGRKLATNCPPLEPRPTATATAQTLRLCQFFISIDDNGCRQISQNCGSNKLFCEKTNEVLWECSQQCEATCDNRTPRCEETCGAPKCQCAPGTIRNSRGECIPRDSCPSNNPPTPQCKFGEILARPDCNRRTCELTCTGQTICNPNCNQPMCTCASGNVRDTRSGLCIPRQQCPSNNPPGCTRDNDCDGNSRICQSGRCINGCNSDNQCDRGLQCRSGRCTIPTCDRDSHCSRGTICIGNRCIEGCRGNSDCSNGFFCVQNQCRRAIGQDPSECRSDDHCRNGFICDRSRCRSGCRNDRQCPNNFNCFNTQCVPRRPECSNNRDCGFNRVCFQGQCRQNSPPRCDQGEEFTNCGSSCEPTCSNRNPICIQRCVPKCQCLRGLVRNRSGRCVPSQFC